MRTGEFRCPACHKAGHATDAKSQGCTLVGPGRNTHYRLYNLPCGCEREVQTTAMRFGIFQCQNCEETSRTLPSNVYLFHIACGPDDWLKLGYSKNTIFRTAQYGLPNDAVVTTVATLSFDTGNEAHAFEAALHDIYKAGRLDPVEMALFHTKGGFAEKL
jgi:hypothetical protein